MAGGRLFVNILSLATAQVVVKLVNAAVSIMVVRYLGTDELGRYSYILAFVYPFGVVADFGLSTYTIREISRDRAREARAIGLLQRALLVLAGLGWAGLMATAGLAHGGGLMLLALALAGTAPLLSALTTPWVVRLIVREHFHLLSVHQIAASLAGTAITVAVLLTGGATMELLGGAVVAGGLAAVLARALAGKGATAETVPWREVGEVIGRVLPFGVMMLGYALYYRIDMVMLQWLRDSHAVGLYAAAYRFLDLAIVLTAALTAPFFTRLSAMAGRDEAGIRGLLEETWKPLVVVASPAIIGIAYAADPLAVTLFGEPFREAGPLLAVLIWGGVPLLLISMPNHALIAGDRVWSLAGVYGLSLFVNVALNLVAIPRWGALGASLATVLCEWMNLVLVVYLVRRRFHVLLSGTGLWRAVGAAAMMGLTLHALSSVHAAFQMLIAAGVYAVCLWGFGYGRDRDAQVLKQLLAR